MKNCRLNFPEKMKKMISKRHWTFLELKLKYITILPRYTIMFTKCFHWKASNQKKILPSRYITILFDPVLVTRWRERKNFLLKKTTLWEIYLTCVLLLIMLCYFSMLLCIFDMIYSLGIWFHGPILRWKEEFLLSKLTTKHLLQVQGMFVFNIIQNKFSCLFCRYNKLVSSKQQFNIPERITHFWCIIILKVINFQRKHWSPS